MTDLTTRTFDAVLFDNDGTLVDSSASAERAWIAWGTEYDVDITSLHGLHGVPAAAIIAERAPGLDQAAALQRIIDLETADVDDVTALPGAADALAALGARATIATSATRDLAVRRLEAVGLPVPPDLVTVEEISRGKPDPEPYLLAAERMGADPARCLVVEDAPSGLASARAAGMASLAVTTTNAADDLDDDLVVPDLSAVRFIVDDDGVRLTLVQP